MDPRTTSPFAWFAALAGIANAQNIIDGKAAPETLGVTAVDAHTLRVQLDKPLPWFSNLTASFAFYPVQKANVDSRANWTRPGSLVGSGAYVLKDRVVNEKLVVVPNTHYWDNAKTVIQQVYFVPITRSPPPPRPLSCRGYRYHRVFPEKYVPETAEGYSGAGVCPAAAGYLLLRFQYPKRPTADERVRLALSMTIDRRVMAEKATGDRGKPAWRFTPDVTAGFTPAVTV